MRNPNLDPKVLIVGGDVRIKPTHFLYPSFFLDESPKNHQLSTCFEPTSHPTLLSSSSSSSCRPYDCLGAILLLSPRALQLLQSVDLFDDVMAHGVKHWQLQIYSNTSATPVPAPFTAAAPLSTATPTTTFDATVLPPDAVYSYKLWENKATDHNFCLSIEQSQLCQLLETALFKRYNIPVDYDCQLVDIQYGGGLENTVFMENEFDADFYLGGDRMNAMTTADTTINSTIQPIIATIKHQQQEQSYQQNCIQVCQTQFLLVANGKSSIVRRKLTDKFQVRQHDQYWRQRMQRQPSLKNASACKNTVAIVDNEGRPFSYSLVVKMKTNYPELKPISIVTKSEGTLILLVHNNYASMMVQQKKGSMKEPLPLVKTQKLVQKLLQPYDIEFLDTCDYYYFTDSTFSSTTGFDAPNMDSRLFFVGDASHETHPPGWISPDMGFEQAINLCWKLKLHMQHRSTPQLLDTYYTETQIKKKDASMASNVLLRLLNDSISITKGGGMAKLLQGHRHCFIGGMLLENNVLNLKCPQTRKVQRGSVGTLAPNARLKPYNLSQLLTQQTNHQYTKSPSLALQPHDKDNKIRKHLPSDLLSTNNDSRSQQEDQGATTKLKFLRGLFAFPSSKKNQPLTSSSVSTTASSTVIAPTNDKWKGIRANHYHLWDQLPSHIGVASSRPTFTVIVLCGSLLDHNSIAALRKLKKHLDQSNSFLRSFEYPSHQYSQQQQQQQPLSQSKSTPTHGSRSLANISNTTASFYSGMPMPSVPPSKTQPQPQPRRSESSSSFYSVKSSNSSTDESMTNDSQYQVRRDSHGTSLKSPQSSIFTRFSTTSSTDRYSMATTVSNSSTISNTNSPPPPVPPLPPSVEKKYDDTTQESPPTSSSSPLFSFICLTTSTKSECSRFLSEQTPYSLHQLFPFGLTKTFLDHDQQAHQLYAVKDHKPTLIIIRPDGYVGAQMAIDGPHLHELDRYFDQFLLPVVDFSSAAAIVADDYCL
ncbi:hypothetical protein BCR42DRAFT_405775 [Absidia repens]|uniref:Uncharacterized protein n=1 Tax=Absidia repens TaxID=90262 RepID=A0A1X2IU05_9FUNG|nr:hypothetical protein BCR42DRAFT_405775 [Absidia repens]